MSRTLRQDMWDTLRLWAIHQVLYWCGVGDCSCQHFLQDGQAGHQYLAHSLRWHRLRSWKFPEWKCCGAASAAVPPHLEVSSAPGSLCFAKFKRVNRGTLGQALICEIGLNSGKALASLTPGRSKPNKHYSPYKGRRSSSQVIIRIRQLINK